MQSSALVEHSFSNKETLIEVNLETKGNWPYLTQSSRKFKIQNSRRPKNSVIKMIKSVT